MQVKDKLYLACVMWHQERETNTRMCRWDKIISRLLRHCLVPRGHKYSIWKVKEIRGSGTVILANITRHKPLVQIRQTPMGLLTVSVMSGADKGLCSLTCDL